MRLDAGKALVEQRFHDDRQRGLGGRRARHQQDGKHQALPVGAHALVDPPPEFGFDRLGAQGRFACGRIQRNHSLQYNYAVDCTGCAPPSAPVLSLTCAPAPAHVRIQLSVCPPAQLGWRCLHEPAQPARPAGGRPAPGDLRPPVGGTCWKASTSRISSRCEARSDPTGPPSAPTAARWAPTAGAPGPAAARLAVQRPGVPAGGPAVGRLPGRRPQPAAALAGGQAGRIPARRRILALPDPRRAHALGLPAGPAQPAPTLDLPLTPAHERAADRPWPPPGWQASASS